MLPTLAMVMVAFSAIWTGRLNPAALTLKNFDYVIFGYRLTQQAILNSLFLALVGATMGVTLALLQAYYLNRGDARRRGLVDALLSLPLGIPGIILGLGFLIIAIRTPLYSTLTIILIAYIARFFPFATRTVSGMLLAINPELEQSARASGASWLQMHALRAPAPAAARDHRRLADAVRDLHPRARRHHPALCARDRDDQRRARAPERAQLRQLCRGAGGHSDCSAARGLPAVRLTRVSLVQS